MPDLRVYIANCPVGGEAVTRLPKGGWKRDRIDLYLGGFPVILRQTDCGMPGRHREAEGHTVHTTTLEFGDISTNKRKRAERIADDLAWLLSAATMSPVRPFSYQFGRGSRTHTITNRTSIFRPLIEIANGKAVRVFVQSTWPNFRRLKRARKLAAVIDYLVIAEQPDQPIEVSTLLVFTALEALNSTHSPGRRQAFEKRIERMLAGVGMRRGLKQLVALRNRLVHEGLAGISHSTLRSHHDRLHDIVREYLLRLLSYRGRYLLYSGASRKARTL
jgi:hypothetical protein